MNTGIFREPNIQN